MNDKITYLEEYKRSLENKKDLDNGTIKVDDISLEELEDVKDLYKNEITKLTTDIKELEKENLRLKKILNK